MGLTSPHSHAGRHSLETQQESKPQYTRASEAFACIICVNVSLAKGSHKASKGPCARARPQVTERRRRITDGHFYNPAQQLKAGDKIFFQIRKTVLLMEIMRKDKSLQNSEG